jgi:hypothetical protein
MPVTEGDEGAEMLLCDMIWAVKVEKVPIR